MKPHNQESVVDVKDQNFFVSRATSSYEFTRFHAFSAALYFQKHNFFFHPPEYWTRLCAHQSQVTTFKFLFCSFLQVIDSDNCELGIKRNGLCFLPQLIMN